MLLTEQEIRSIMRSVKEIGENSDRALILATEAAVIAKIKAQEETAWIHKDGTVYRKPAGGMPLDWTPLYRLPEGD